MLKYTATFSTTPSANPTTLVQVYAATDRPVSILGADIFLRGSTPATAPIPFDWVVQTSAGVGSTLTPQRQDRGLADTPTATVAWAFSSEPTGATQLIVLGFHQQAAALWRPPAGHQIHVKGEERVGLRYRSGSYVEVSVTLYLQE